MDAAGVPFVSLFLISVQDEADILQYFEGHPKVDFGLVFYQGDDEQRFASGQVNAFDNVRLTAVLKEGDKVVFDILDVFRLQVFEQFDGDIVPEELDKEGVFTKDQFEAIIFGVVNSHCSLRTIYGA